MNMSDLPLQYTDKTSLEESIDSAIESYRQGNIMEGFVLLGAHLEFLLNVLSKLVILSVRKDKKFEPEDRDFNTNVTLLFDLEILNNRIKTKLLSFRKGRNTVVHRIFSTSTKLKMKILNQQFKDGFECCQWLLGKITLYHLKNQKKPLTFISKTKK